MVNSKTTTNIMAIDSTNIHEHNHVVADNMVNNINNGE